MSGQGDL